MMGYLKELGFEKKAGIFDWLNKKVIPGLSNAGQQNPEKATPPQAGRMHGGFRKTPPKINQPKPSPAPNQQKPSTNTTSAKPKQMPNSAWAAGSAKARQDSGHTLNDLIKMRNAAKASGDTGAYAKAQNTINAALNSPKKHGKGDTITRKPATATTSKK
jgi:hypothetical protein